MVTASSATALHKLEDIFAIVLMGYTLNCNRLFRENLQATFFLEYARFLRFLHAYLSCAVVLYTVIEGRHYSKKLSSRR